MKKLDVTANRKAAKWNWRIQGARVLWGAAQPLFRFSPRPLWGWRCLLLRAFGARIGRQVHIYPSARITMPWHLVIGDLAAVGDGAILYALGQISIGTRATVSQGAHLCAGSHDVSSAHRPLIKLPIVIGDDAWVAAEAFVGPGVTLGDGAILGARGVAMRDIPARAIFAGNPARLLRMLP